MVRSFSLTRLTLCTVLVLVSASTQAEWIIDTVAGGGPNNVPALSANLLVTQGVVVDASGNLFIAVKKANYIYKVATSGVLTIVAGTGVPNFSGDGGPATSAGLNNPSAVALDAAGNLFIADFFNLRIRRVDAATGIISTVAGNGTFGFSGDGGPATSASLAHPIGVAVDATGNLFISDRGNLRIRRVDAATGIISTVAGNGAIGFSGDGGPATSTPLSGPWGVALDAVGNLFIADREDHSVRRVDVATGIISTVAGTGVRGFSGDGGLATSASLALPNGVALDTAGNLFINDFVNLRIRRVDAATGIISTVAGNGSLGFSGDGGPATSGSLLNPLGVALDTASNLFIADSGNQRIRRVDTATGIISTVAGNGFTGFNGDGDLATNARLDRPTDVALDTAGNIFVADWRSNRIRRVDVATGVISTVAGNGRLGFNGDGGPATSASLNNPSGVAVDATGNLFFADVDNNRIRRVDTATGIISTVAGNGITGFSGDGDLAINARLNRPTDVALDTVGNLFISDRLNHRIRRVDAATGVISTVAGNGIFGVSGDGGPATSARLAAPISIAVDPAGSTLFIDDFSNHRIRRVRLTTQPPVADLVFAPPLIANASAAFKEIKVGRTIPVKFRLGDGATPEATVTATIAVFRVINIATGSLDTTDLVADAGRANSNSNLFRFDRIAQQYIFNLSTKGFQTPATYRIFVTLDDGSQKSVDFALRR